MEVYYGCIQKKFKGIYCCDDTVYRFYGDLSGYLESRVIGKRGLISGALSALIFVVLILLAAEGVFSDMPEASKHTLAYLLPVAGGGAGGIAGVAGEN